MAEVAALGLRVDGIDNIEKATDALSEFAKEAEKAEKVTEGLAESFDDVAPPVKETKKNTDAAKKSTEDYNKAASATTKTNEKTAKSFFATENSAKQTSMAMRQLPAQFNDIIVSLQGGQAPLTVLLQQGAQIRDSFGGIGAALSGVARGLGYFINPVGLVAAAVGTLTGAYIQGGKEAREFEKALALTGDASGVTTNQLTMMAQVVGAVEGNTSKAADALAKIAASGKVAGDQLAMVAESALRFSRVTGEELDDVIERFTALGDNPVEATAKLNKETGFLTTALQKEIEALSAQGKEAEASALAMERLAIFTDSASERIEERLGYLEQAWMGVGKGISWAWSQLKEIGRDTTVQEEIAEIEESLERIRSRNRATDAPAIRALENQLATRKQILLTEEVVAEFNAQSKRDTELATEARRRNNEQLAAGATNAEKLQKALAQIDKDRDTRARAGDYMAEEEYLKLRAAAEKQYSEQVKKTAEYRDSEATRLIMSLRAQEASLRGQNESTETLTNEERKRLEFVQYIADLKEKKELTADQKSVLAAKDKIIAQLNLNAGLSAEIAARKKLEQEEEARKRKAEEEERRREREREKAGKAFDDVYIEISRNLTGNTEIDNLQKTYDERKRIIDKALTTEAKTKDDHKRAMNMLDAKYNTESLHLTTQWMLQSGQNMFDGFARIAQATSGEMSKTYRTLFVMGKSFAIAMAGINFTKALSDALGAPDSITFAQKLANWSAVVSLGGGLVQSIRNTEMTGFQSGGYTGNMGVGEIAGVVHGQEYVVDAATTARVGVRNLDAISKGKGIGSNVTINVIEDQSRAGRIEESQRAQNERVIDLFVADFAGGGRTRNIIQRTFALNEVGR